MIEMSSKFFFLRTKFINCFELPRLTRIQKFHHERNGMTGILRTFLIKKEVIKQGMTTDNRQPNKERYKSRDLSKKSFEQ